MENETAMLQEFAKPETLIRLSEIKALTGRDRVKADILELCRRQHIKVYRAVDLEEVRYEE